VRFAWRWRAVEQLERLAGFEGEGLPGLCEGQGSYPTVALKQLHAGAVFEDV
jgi:hypothetical protein